MSESVGVESLAAHAHETPVVVIGGGIAGLVTALECAKVGLRVTLIEAEDELGGTIRSAELAGLRVDVGADGWSTAGGVVRPLVDELGLDASVVAEQRRPAWISGLPSGAAPVPEESVVGIPANSWDPAVRRIIGWRGVWRAYLDRLRPPLTIGAERNLDKLVRGRMGDLVADRLVAPLTRGRHGLDPRDVDVEYAAPGLSTALTRTGSLSGGVAQLRGESTAAPSVETIDGGLALLVAALRTRLAELEVRILTRATATGLERAGSAWLVDVETPDGVEQVAASHIAVATDEATAHVLLGPHVPALAAIPASARVLDVVSLVVESSLLDAHPRGGAVYPLPGSSSASAVVDATARWPWLAECLGPARHLLRVHFADGAPEDALSVAESAASEALGVDLSGRVLDSRVDRFPAALPPSAIDQVGNAGRARGAIVAVSGLAVVGAWVAGSGLANVVPDAVEAAERIRRRALFGSSAVE